MDSIFGRKISKRERSAIMSAIRSRGNRSTEIALLKLFKREKITGWRRHYKRIYGTPDFAFPKQRLAIFVDGCFWHGCNKCASVPKSNFDFWKLKVTSNRNRDRKVNGEIKSEGWSVMRFWEHDIRRRPNRVFSRIAQRL